MSEKKFREINAAFPAASLQHEHQLWQFTLKSTQVCVCVCRRLDAKQQSTRVRFRVKETGRVLLSSETKDRKLDRQIETDGEQAR